MYYYITQIDIAFSFIFAFCDEYVTENFILRINIKKFAKVILCLRLKSSVARYMRKKALFNLICLSNLFEHSNLIYNQFCSKMLKKILILNISIKGKTDA